jgi:PAS domain S-box-containing protein
LFQGGGPVRQGKKFSRYIYNSILWGILLLIVGLTFYHYIVQILVDSYRNNIADYAKHTSKIIEEKISRNLVILENIASSSYIKSPYITTGEKLEYLKKEASANNYTRLCIVDISGNLKSTDKKEANISDRIYFKKALSGQKNVSSPLKSRLDGTMVVMFAVPIKNDGNVLGVLYAALEAEELCMVVESISHESNLSAFIINAEGLLIADKNRDLVYASENLLTNALNDSAQSEFLPYLKQITKGKTNSVLCNYKGTRSFIAFTPVEGTNWSVVVTSSKSQVLKRTNYFLTSLIAFFILIAMVFVAIYIYNKYLKVKLAIETSTVNKITGAANTIIIHLDLSGKIMFFNKYAEEKTGYQKDETINLKTIFDITSENECLKIKELLSEISDRKSINGFEFSLKDREGNIKTVIWNIEFNENFYKGNCNTIELIGIDITKRVDAENKLLESYEVIKTLAYYDSLTGLSNRYILYEKLQMAIEYAVKNNKTGALVLIDLDNFKNINDSYGILSATYY